MATESPQEPHSMQRTASIASVSMNAPASVRRSRRPEVNAVRANVQNGMDQELLRKTFLLSVCITAIEMVASLSVLSTHWEPQCDAPLRYWVLVKMILRAVQLVLSAMRVKNPPDSSIYAHADGLLRPINLGVFMWVIFGSVWIFRTETCSDDVPHLYRLTFVLLAFSWLFASLNGLVVVLSFLCLPVYLDTFSNLVDTRSRGADDDVIAKIPNVEYQEGMVQDPNDAMCAMCMEEYVKGVELKFLPCNHHFHSACVVKWLGINKTCPICRRAIDEQSAPEA